MTEFNLNPVNHIHEETCYVCFSETRSGLAAINRALAAYQKVNQFGVCFVGDRHEICLIREKLQALRFETL